MIENMESKLIIKKFKLIVTDTDDDNWGEIIVEKDCVAFGLENTWLVECVHVEFEEFEEQAKALRHQLYDQAEKMALEAGCRLVPSPDMLQEELDFWCEVDPEATLKVLTHPNAVHYFEREGLGDDLDRLRCQAAALKERFEGK